MDSKRQQKFSRLIQKELGEIFQRDSKSLFGNVWITVTQVRVSPDLSVAKVYLSFLMTDNKEQSLADVNEKNKAIRQTLAAKIRHQVRIIPELIFYLDDTAEYAAKMDALISGLTIPAASKDKDEEE
ncbi:30S ribosome-binding factor RbfA [Cytophagaceae bacterium DM2B3-1]|uniref:Ribosome-binding factor A n=1 Tax=Xanthocytophaga flava TaxID=3048013 RepID=A0AAE3UAI1_9BACT|nr:30S ribosome-binding factor RbfA [Xanthocytophaga flavus]MDJ1471398.1 30S ribosome-binding factor RbfA [Xanthocytophaga flavus]MDJ1484742.1 30S ribosome-binding factor RbfA [Xanthocytophaga flavus]MDJ1496726.1 30S ribosome-binding factor RbfA [Xanthocytophaga flavus]